MNVKGAFPLTQLRWARPADHASIRTILFDTFETTWLPAILPAAAQAYRDEDRPSLYLAARGHCFLVAECSGEVIGFADWQADFVNALHVRSDHARCGVGSALMNRVEAAIAAEGFPAARLETDTFNARSQAFYLGRGYREEARYPDKEWNSGLTTILYVKPL